MRGEHYCRCSALFTWRMLPADVRQHARTPWNNHTSKSLFHIPRPPSTSILIPVMKDPSSLAKNNAVFAISYKVKIHGQQLSLNISQNTRIIRSFLKLTFGSVKRPRGTFWTNAFLFSGVSGTPTKLSNSPVPDKRGAIALTLMLFGPYSAAKPLVAYIFVS
jgi:hypothetical protein